MSSLTGEGDPFETESKSVYRDYLVSKYPDLCTSDYTSNSLISNLSSFKLTYELYLPQMLIFVACDQQC